MRMRMQQIKIKIKVNKLSTNLYLRGEILQIFYRVLIKKSYINTQAIFANTISELSFL